MRLLIKTTPLKGPKNRGSWMDLPEGNVAILPHTPESREDRVPQLVGAVPPTCGGNIP